MQVFKAYFKVLRASIPYLTINLSIFLGLAVIFSLMAPAEDRTRFEPTRVSIAVINRDKGAPLAQGLVDYLSQKSMIIPYPDDRELLQDALFYRSVDYIAIIPQNFSEDFLAGKETNIQKVVVPESAASFYIDMYIDKFLQTVSLHHLYGGVKSLSELVTLTLADLSPETAVTLQSFGLSGGPEPNHSFYFRYCAYALLAMVVTGISAVMITFNKTDLSLRNLCTPLPKRKQNLQLLAGHATFALGCWLLLMLSALLLYRQNILASGLLKFYLLNTLAFTMVSLSIGFAVGSTIKNHNAMAGAVNVIALGMNFLGGVFIPQSIMSKSVLAVAQFIPSYWFVKANDGLLELVSLSRANLSFFYDSILIQLGFALAIFSVTLLVIKEKRLSHLG